MVNNRRRTYLLSLLSMGEVLYCGRPIWTSITSNSTTTYESNYLVDFNTISNCRLKNLIFIHLQKDNSNNSYQYLKDISDGSESYSLGYYYSDYLVISEDGVYFKFEDSRSSGDEWIPLIIF